MIKSYLISLTILLIIDLIWLGFIAKKFYQKELSKISRKQKGKFKPLIIIGFLVYLILPIGLAIFVFPISQTTIQALAYGALFGFLAYSTYDLTNFSTLENFSLKLTILDITWGTFLCGITSFLTKLILLKI